MSHYVEEGFKGYTATAAIAAYKAVKLDANKNVVAAAAATDVVIGTIHRAVKAGYDVDVRLRSASGTMNIMVGAAAIAQNAPVTVDANGLGLTATVAGSQIVGYALEAGAAGAVIEVMPSTAKF